MPPDSPLAVLTPREREILGFIGRGLTIPEIAEKLFRSQKTIESHRQSLGRKLQVGNRVELARIAIQTGLSPLDPAPGGACGQPRRHRVAEGPAAEALARIDGACADAVGPQHLRCLVQHVTDACTVGGCIVSTYNPEAETFRSLAFYHRGQWQDNVTMDVKRAPCFNTLREGFWHVDTDLAERFPELAHMDGFTLHSYLGVRLDGCDGKPLGALMVFQDRPAPVGPEVRDVLEALRPRTAGEVYRVCLTERLQRRIEGLETRLGRE